MYCAIDRLRDHANELNGNAKLQDALDKMQAERRRKAAQLLCDHLAMASRAKEAECVRNLQEMNLEAKQREELAKLEAERRNRLRNKLVRDLVKNQVSKELQCLNNLKNYNQRIKAEEQLRLYREE